MRELGRGGHGRDPFPRTRLADGTQGRLDGHPEYVFSQTFSVSPIGVESGDIEIDGKTYHFAHGFDGYDRAEQGQKMTQAFLATLPKGWTKSKLELDKSAVNKAKPTEDDLAEAGLVRKVKQTWTELP